MVTGKLGIRSCKDKQYAMQNVYMRMCTFMCVCVCVVYVCVCVICICVCDICVCTFVHVLCVCILTYIPVDIMYASWCAHVVHIWALDLHTGIESAWYSIQLSIVIEIK